MPLRARISAAMVAALAIGTLPALANYFDQAAHTAAMNDIAATPPWEEPGQEDYGYDEEPDYSYREWETWSNELVHQPGPVLHDDPGYAAFLNGEWLHKSPLAGSPDQTCSAMFLRKGAGAIVVALGGRSDPALFIFFGRDIPAPAQTQTIEATLTQTGEQPATVDAFNKALPWAPDFGTVVFAVPTAEAALGGMLDTQAFGVGVDGESVAEIEWTGGLAARDRLAACIASRG